MRFNGKYIGLQGWTDSRVGNNQEFIIAQIDNFPEFKKKIEKINIGLKLAVGFSINPLNHASRKNDDVIEIQNILIDLDGQNIYKDYEAVKMFLKANNIKSVYEDKSGNGYHFLIPLEFKLHEKDLVEKFLEFLKKECKIGSLDTRVKLLTQILRVPESIHRKTGTDIKLETLEWNRITNSDVEDNTKNIRNVLSKAHFQEITKENPDKIIQQDESEKDDGDYFFAKILGSPGLRKYLSNKSGISKNDVLFKNLAIFLIRHPKFSKNGNQFVRECKHSMQEFDGWIKKSTDNKITKINYLEIKNWVITNELVELKPLIDKQILIEGNYINNYEMCFIKNIKTPTRYLLFNKSKTSLMVSNEADMFTTILLESDFADFDFMEYYSIYPYNDKGEELSEVQKNNKVINKLRKTIKQYNLLMPIYDFGYKPTKEKYFDYNGEQYFNTYKTGPLEDWFEEKDSYKFPYIKKLIMNLVNADKKGYEYFLKWLSFILVNPQMKLPSSVIFMGTQGIGKGRFREWILPGIWGKNNVTQVNQTHLEDKWTDWLVNVRFIIANEIQVAGRSKDQVRKKIKEYSTDQDVSVQLKGRDSSKIQNYSHWLFFSDQEVPFEIESNDRRHTVFNCDTPLDVEIAKVLSPELNPGYLEKELKDFVSYLKTLNVKFKDVERLFLTESKKKLIDMSKDSSDRFMEELKNFKTLKQFCRTYEHPYGIDSVTPERQFKDIVLVRDLYNIYIHWCDKNTIYFKKSTIGFSMSLSKKHHINSHRDALDNVDLHGQRYFKINEVLKK